MSGDIGRQLETLERVVVQLLHDIGELRRDVSGATIECSGSSRREVEIDVLDKLVDQLGNAAAAHAVVRSYIDSLPGRIIAVSVDEDRSTQVRAELRLASELVGAVAMAHWCCERDGEPPLTITLEGLERWLTGTDGAG